MIYTVNLKLDKKEALILSVALASILINYDSEDMSNVVKKVLNMIDKSVFGGENELLS